jgi:hypothetical protein
MSLLRLIARNRVTQRLPRLPHDLVITEISRPTEGAPRPSPAIIAMANAVDLSLAFDADCGITATTTRFPQHSHLRQNRMPALVYCTIADLAYPKG